jgi:hypothetical protein
MWRIAALVLPLLLPWTASLPHESAERLSAPAASVVVDVPGSTRQASVVVSVAGANPSTVVVVTGGALPATAEVDPDQTAAVLVPLRAGTTNRLRVETVVGTAIDHNSVTVRQFAARGTGTVRGRVVDAVSGRALRAATIGYARSKATTNRQGRFTLTDVPAGLVVATVHAKGHVAGAAVGYVGPRASIQVRATALPPLGASEALRPGGGVLKGPGWRVVVPRGAVRTSTQVRVRATGWTGDVDLAGIPTIEVLPESLRFEKPLEVHVAKQMVGLPPGSEDPPVRLSLVNPSTLAASPLPSNVSSNFVSTQLAAGGQVRVPPPPPKLQDARQCTSFGSEQAGQDAAQNALTLARTSADAWSVGGRVPAARSLFRAYLTPGTFSPTIRQVTDDGARKEFRDDPVTQQKVNTLLQQVLQQLATAPPPLQDPATPYTNSLDAAGLGKHVDIAWSGLTTPGLIAGGKGSLIWPWPSGTTYLDDRNIAGDYRVIPTLSSRGVVLSVRLQSSVLDLEVIDSIDFCPGNLAGTFGQFLGRTLDMSRLETTPHPSGYWATPIRWRLTTKLSPQDIDVTFMYPSNDPDQDEVPDTQPWPRAGYTLDNCPGTANPDQTDSDNDGVGDACQCPAQLAPRQRAAETCGGGLSYDIHLNFVCNQCPYGQSTYTAIDDINLKGAVPLNPGAVGSLNYTSASIDGTWDNVYSGNGGCGIRPPDPSPDPPGPFCDLTWHLGQSHDTAAAWTVLEVIRDRTSGQLTSVTLQFASPTDETYPAPWPWETMNYACSGHCSSEMNGPLPRTNAFDEIVDAYDYTFTVDGFEPDPVTGAATVTDHITTPHFLADGVLSMTATWTEECSVPNRTADTCTSARVERP